MAQLENGDIWFECTIERGWIDYNGHLRDGYYGLIFSYGVDHFMTIIGIDAGYRANTGGTLYVIEDHRFYLKEVTADSKIRVATSVLDYDIKRIHLIQRLFVDNEEAPAALCESMQLHVCQFPTPTSSAIPEAIRARLCQLKSSITGDYRAGTIAIRPKL